MQTKWVEARALCRQNRAKARRRKAVNSAGRISPEAMANSRCRTLPSPPAWPAMGTL